MVRIEKRSIDARQRAVVFRVCARCWSISAAPRGWTKGWQSAGVSANVSAVENHAWGTRPDLSVQPQFVESKIRGTMPRPKRQDAAPPRL